MQLTRVTTQAQKVRLALQGPSGSGKTYSALLLAYGLTGAYGKIALIDTDSAASLYSYFGPFQTLQLAPPFAPKKFHDALELCERSGIEVIIIDSISAEWADEGGVQDTLRSGEEGDSIIDAHTDFLRAIRNCSTHVLVSLRSQEGYHLHIAGDKKEVQKIGLEPIQQKDIHYLFHSVLQLDAKHRAKPLKDRTSFFEEHGSVLITEEVAALHAQWCNQKRLEGIPEATQQQINACTSISELLALSLELEEDNVFIRQALIQRKEELQQTESNPILSRHNIKVNGTDHFRASA